MRPIVALSLVDDAVVAGEAGRLLGDHAEAGRVVVAPGDQRGARRRAQRGGEHAVVAQAFLRDAVHRRRRDDAAEGAGHAEAGVVGDDQQHVRRALRRHDARRPPRLRLQRVVLDHAAELRVGRRQLLAADGRRGAGRTRRAGDLLRRDRRRREYRDRQECAQRPSGGSRADASDRKFQETISHSPVPFNQRSCAATWDVATLLPLTRCSHLEERVCAAPPGPGYRTLVLAEQRRIRSADGLRGLVLAPTPVDYSRRYASVAEADLREPGRAGRASKRRQPSGQ